MAENYFGITDTGKQRENNEDTFIAEPILGNRFIAACVIDGVGGYAGGEVAADIARQSILDYFSVLSGDITTMMKEALMVANEKIFAQKQQREELQQMACVATLALADIKSRKLYYAHVGDTRLYLLRDRSLVKLTKDHSFVGYLEDSGRLTEAAAMQHPKRNEINKALGIEGHLTLASDYIETGESPFLPGDLLLLCSDGLTDLVSSSEITALLQKGKTLAEKGAALVAAANEAGGKDNITVVLVHNNARPVKQVATKPTAVKKKEPSGSKAAPVELPVRTVEKIVVQKKTNYIPVVILSVLCLVLLAGFLWQLFQKPNAVAKNEIAVEQPVNPLEQQLTDTINRLQGDTLILHDSLFQSPVIIGDTVWITKDTLYLKGNGRMVFLSDSAYAGPALALGANCRSVVLDNIILENFDVGILVQHPALQLKNVQFINCRVPVQYQLLLPNNQKLNGVLKNPSDFKTDSIIKLPKQ